MPRDEEDDEVEDREDEKELSDAELEKYSSLVGTATIPEEKPNVHSFLIKVVETDDTTKLGNLTEEEVGTPKHPLRTEKELELFCNDIADMPYFAGYFRKEAEIMTSTSLSKEALLLNLAVVQRREVRRLKPRRINKGWFRKRRQEVSEY